MNVRTADHARCTAVIVLACTAIVAAIAYVHAAPNAGRTQLNIEARTPAGSSITPYTTTRSAESAIYEEANSLSTDNRDEAVPFSHLRSTPRTVPVCATI